MQSELLLTQRFAWTQSNNEGQAALDALADPKQAELLQLAAYLTAASNPSGQVCKLTDTRVELDRGLLELQY